MLNMLHAAVDRVQPDALVIGFDSPGDQMRRRLYPEYWGTRSEKNPDLVSQLELTPKMLAYAGFAIRAIPGLEADNVTAKAAADGIAAGWHTVIVTSDRDAFAHIGEYCSVLGMINGGVDASPLLTPGRIQTMVGIAPHQYLDYAALRGDTSDNLPGVHGIGEKTAAKLLTVFGSMERVWADLRDNEGDRIASEVDKAVRTKLSVDAYEAWERNVRIMRAHLDLDLGIDLSVRTGEGHLPMDPAPLTEACQVVSFDATLPALLRSLTRTRGQAPRPAEPVAEPTVAPVPDRLPATSRTPSGAAARGAAWLPRRAGVRRGCAGRSDDERAAPGRGRRAVPTCPITTPAPEPGSGAGVLDRAAARRRLRDRRPRHARPDREGARQRLRSRGGLGRLPAGPRAPPVPRGGRRRARPDPLGGRPPAGARR
jgi:5'-3' exonuclease